MKRTVSSLSDFNRACSSNVDMGKAAEESGETHTASSRISPAPPFVLPSQRLGAHTGEQSEKFARFRGVLGVGLSRIRTGDAGFGAWTPLQPAFFSVGKLGGSDSLQIRRGLLRVRILLAPPPSLPSQRLRAHSREQSEKTPRFRGVLGIWPSRNRTGDGEFDAKRAPQAAVFSVGKLGGPDSLLIRPS